MTQTLRFSHDLGEIISKYGTLYSPRITTPYGDGIFLGA